MFTQISWSDYIEAVLVLLIIYYSAVGLKLYAQELKLVFSGKQKLPMHTAAPDTDLEDEQDQTSSFQNVQSELFSSSKRYMPCEQDTDETFEQVQDLTARIKQVIAEAISKHLIKEEFILSLQLLIRKYQFLKGPPFMVAINNLIVSECEKLGYLMLDAEERVMLWNE